MNTKLGAAVVVALVIMIEAAAAQTVDMRSTAISVLEWLANLLTMTLIALLGIAIRFVSAKFGLANSQLEQNLNDRLNDIIHRGMQYALATAINEIQKRGSGLEAVKFDNYFISLAASYVNERAPEILKKFSVTQEKLIEMIYARIPDYATQVPIVGGASATSTAKAVQRETGGPAADAPRPVVTGPRTETPLPDPEERTTFRTQAAPDTGA